MQDNAQLGFPQAVRDFATTFRPLMEARHDADYNPAVKFKRAEVLIILEDAKNAARGLRELDGRQKTAFAVYALLPPPRT